MNRLGPIAGLLVTLLHAGAAEAFPRFDALPREEAERRTQQVLGIWGKSPVLGDDSGFDQHIAALETKIVRREVMLFDSVGLLGTNALVSLDREILHLGLKEEGEENAPNPTVIQPTMLATHQIMRNRPYCAGAIGAAAHDDPLVRQLALGLMGAGEAGLDRNIAGALATALATTADGGMTSISDELRQRSAHLRMALAGGYRLPRVPVVQTPFDNVLATWCLWPRPVGEEDVFIRANAAFEKSRTARGTTEAVERAWQQVVSAYQEIHGTRGTSPLGWKQAMAGVVLPVLIGEIIAGLDDYEKNIGVNEAGIPLPGAESGSEFAGKYAAWIRTGGGYLHSPADMSKGAGGATLPRMRLIGAAWLFDRLLEEVPETAAANATLLPFDAEVLSQQLDPLRRMSSVIVNQGPTDEQLNALRRLLPAVLLKLQAHQSLIMQQLVAWHPKIDAIPSLGGWNITATRTAKYCRAVGVLGKALADDAQHAAARDFFRLQRDVASILALYDQQYANYGPPMLYSHVRAIRLGVAALAARTSQGSSYSYGAVPSANSRVLELPERLAFEDDAAYWRRACTEVIFPSFRKNAIEHGIKEVALVWIRSRAGSTRMASVALDRLMVGAWSVRALVKEGIVK